MSTLRRPLTEHEPDPEPWRENHLMLDRQVTQQYMAKYSLRLIGFNKDDKPVLYMCLAQGLADCCKEEMQGWEDHVRNLADALSRSDQDNAILFLDPYRCRDSHDPETLVDGMKTMKDFGIRIEHFITIECSSPTWMGKWEAIYSKKCPLSGKEELDSIPPTWTKPKFREKVYESYGKKLGLDDDLLNWMLETREELSRYSDMELRKELPRCYQFWKAPETDGGQDFRATTSFVNGTIKDPDFLYLLHPLIEMHRRSQFGEIERYETQLNRERSRMTSADDQLDHGLYAQILTDIMKDPKTDTPLTVGLFANWGRGKTSTIELLEEQMTKVEAVDGSEETSSKAYKDNNNRNLQMMQARKDKEQVQWIYEWAHPFCMAGPQSRGPPDSTDTGNETSEKQQAEKTNDQAVEMTTIKTQEDEDGAIPGEAPAKETTATDDDKDKDRSAAQTEKDGRRPDGNTSEKDEDTSAGGGQGYQKLQEAEKKPLVPAAKPQPTRQRHGRPCCYHSVKCHVLGVFTIFLLAFFLLCVVSGYLFYRKVKGEKKDGPGSSCDGKLTAQPVNIDCLQDQDNMTSTGTNQTCSSLIDNEKKYVSNQTLVNCTIIGTGQIQCSLETCIEKENSEISWYTLWICLLLAFFIILGLLLMIIYCTGGSYSSAEVFFTRWAELFTMAFFFPIKQEKKNWPVEFIKVKFNAWEYAGCDMLWAGIITCLCDKIEARFGSLRSRYFRVVKAKLAEAQELAADKIKDTESRTDNKHVVFMHPYTTCLVPNYMCMFFWVFFILLAVIVLAMTVEIEAGADYKDLAQKIMLGLIGSGSLAALIAACVRLILLLSKTTKSYIENLQNEMSKPDFKEELGFMHLVKEEVELLNDLIEYMEQIKHKQYRVVLLVDDLDRCEKKKVLKMLEAVSIILSEPGTRFISIVAVDPRVVIKSLELAVDVIMRDTRINGHEYLKKIIHLPFWLPEMDDKKVSKLVQSYIPADVDNQDDAAGKEENLTTVEMGKPTLKDAETEGQAKDGLQTEEDDPGDRQSPSVSTTSATKGPKDSESIQDQAEPKQSTSGVKAVPLVRSGINAYKVALEYIRDNPKHICHNPRAIKRICNVLNMAVRLFVEKNQRADEQQIHRLTCWLIFVEQWPYRASLLIQLEEDFSQKQNLRKSVQVPMNEKI